MMIDERRVRRSEEPKRALALFLESSRKRLGVHALTVSTVDGRLLAGSGEGALLVAALGARVDSGEDTTDRIAIWRMHIGKRKYVIASLGAMMSADIGAGVRRILS